MTYRFGAIRQAGAYTFGVGGLGVRGADLPLTGTHGPGITALDAVLPAEADDEFMYRITVAPPLLTVFRWFDNGSVEAEGPDGVHIGIAERRKNGGVYGTREFYVLIGVSGGLSGTVTLDDVVASGALASSPSGLSGTVTLDDVVASGALGGVPVVPDLTAYEMRQMYDWVRELYMIHGLMVGVPLVVSPTSRTAGAISQSISTDGSGTTTVTRL